MKLRTSELNGAALDWAVAKCLGHRVAENYGTYIRIYLPNPKQSGYTLAFCPSTDWALAGPIIERERIGLGHAISEGNSYWFAIGYLVEECGPTPLIAAMRCYVASKLGDEVEVPGGLFGDDEPPEPEFSEPRGKLLRDYTIDDFNPKMKHWSDT